VFWSVLRLPTNGSYLGPLFQAIGLLGSANTFVVAMSRCGRPRWWMRAGPR